jgi:hypothetical protein
MTAPECRPPRNPGPISDQTWEAIRAEFSLPSLAQVRHRLAKLIDDPEPVMQQLVRVIDDNTFCPGFQFLPGLDLHPTVAGLFHRALELKIPHNYFAVWMVTPCPALQGTRPVDYLGSRQVPVLMAALERTLAPATAWQRG